MTENCHIDIKHLHCCHKCAMNDKHTQQRITNTFLNNYGVKSCFQAESVKKKIGDTNEIRYGARQFSQSKKYLEIGNANNWWPETSDMRKKRGETLRKTLANKSIEEKRISVEKARRTSMKRYGVENWVKSEAYRNLYLDKNWANKKKAKEINTKIRNGTTNSSKPEESAYKTLCEKFGVADVKRQYKSEKYPFFCDFYVRSLDLFIECNFHWTHWKSAFDPENPEHIKILNIWRQRAESSKFYRTAIKVWTVRDPEKIKTALSNDLSLLVFYTLADFEKYFKNN